MSAPVVQNGWGKTSGKTAFLAMHVILFIVCLIVAALFLNMVVNAATIILAIVIVVIPQVALLAFKSSSKSKIMRELGVDEEHALRIINGTYHQHLINRWPDLGQLGYVLKTKGFKTKILKQNELFILDYNLFINLIQRTSQSSSASHHRQRVMVYYEIQLGPSSPQTAAVEEQIKSELMEFLMRGGYLS